MKKMIVSGARVVTPGRDLGVADVRIENCVIAEVAAKVSPTAGERVVEADGLTLLPGFVDIHSHGRGGADFCDATDAARSPRDRLRTSFSSTNRCRRT